MQGCGIDNMKLHQYSRKVHAGQYRTPTVVIDAVLT